jgi:zinc transport system substrate-binding protein
LSRFNLGLPRLIFALLPAAFLSAACQNGETDDASVCVTIAPLEMIIRPIAAAHADIVTLLPPGASPHTFELTPSRARQASRAVGIFYVDSSLDAWGAEFDRRRAIAVLPMLPEELVQFYGEGSHRTADPHFWLDPIAVREVTAPIAARLSELDPSHADEYSANAVEAMLRLDVLHQELSAILEPIRRAVIVQHHPSMNYFLARYGLRSIGSVEPSPGQEPTPRDLQRLAEAIRAENVRAVVTEPQLPRAPVEALAEMTGTKVVELDPIGGMPGRATYEELLRYNARALVEALK